MGKRKTSPISQTAAENLSWIFNALRTKAAFFVLSLLLCLSFLVLS
jgi:hypothetical protein